jgi:hypothetical protein
MTYLTPQQREFEGEGNEAMRHVLKRIECWCKLKIVHDFKSEIADVIIHNAETLVPLSKNSSKHWR